MDVFDGKGSNTHILVVRCDLRQEIKIVLCVELSQLHSIRPSGFLRGWVTRTGVQWLNIVKTKKGNNQEQALYVSSCAKGAIPTHNFMRLALFSIAMVIDGWQSRLQIKGKLQPYST